MRVLRQEPSILAKGTAFADMKATICGAIGAATMDQCFPQFDDIIVAAREGEHHEAPSKVQSAISTGPIIGK